MAARDLVVVSHLRWTWVWQRPQQLISRLAGDRRVWFVEEPVRAPCAETTLGQEDAGRVTRVWLEIPSDVAERRFNDMPPDGHVGFDDPRARAYPELLADLIGPGLERVLWLYTPLAHRFARALEPAVVAYDVMDDLASFAHAPAGMVDAQRRLLDEAHVVFTGGRSLHRGVTRLREHDVWLFPSGVDNGHYASARALRKRGGRPVAGYVGVIDERLDLDLIADLAALLPDWDIHMVGPVAKIDPEALPAAPNIKYLGSRSYDELPAVMAAMDVALMPFALNDATKSISPTKTLEYLAAGLPVVSTPVADVVTDYGHVIDVVPDAVAFARTCRRALSQNVASDPVVQAVLQRHDWKDIAARMKQIVETPLRRATTLSKETA